MEPTLKMDRSRMSPPSPSTGSPFILKFSAATVGLSAHHYSAKGTSAPTHPLTPGLGMNGDRVVKSFLWVKAAVQERLSAMDSRAEGAAGVSVSAAPWGTVPLCFHSLLFISSLT